MDRGLTVVQLVLLTICFFPNTGRFMDRGLTVVQFGFEVVVVVFLFNGDFEEYFLK